MDPMVKQALITIALDVLTLAILVPTTKHILMSRLDEFDDKREQARHERAESARRAEEQREAERGIVLAIARTMLLDNYEACVAKGYYSVEEREVYGKLFQNYRSDGGNGIIETLADRIRELPLEPPEE